MKSIKLIQEILRGQNMCEIEKKDANGITIKVKIGKNQPYCSSISMNMGNRIPKQYIEFLSYSNGMELFNYDNIDGLKLLSFQEIEKYTLYAKNTYEEDWNDNIMIFAKLIGEDNYLGFRIEENQYEIIDCYFEDSPFEWKMISKDYDDFLTKYIKGFGDKYWI